MRTSIHGSSQPMNSITSWLPDQAMFESSKAEIVLSGLPIVLCAGIVRWVSRPDQHSVTAGQEAGRSHPSPSDRSRTAPTDWVPLPEVPLEKIAQGLLLKSWSHVMINANSYPLSRLCIVAGFYILWKGATTFIRDDQNPGYKLRSVHPPKD